MEKTKVLGLTMDRKLKYIEHGKDINRKILGRWVMICKHTNRNWGFKQHVIVRLLSQKLKITDFSANISLIKNQLKKALFHQQHIEQTVQWTPEDFNFDKIKL